MVEQLLHGLNPRYSFTVTLHSQGFYNIPRLGNCWFDRLRPKRPVGLQSDYRIESSEMIHPSNREVTESKYPVPRTVRAGRRSFRARSFIGLGPWLALLSFD